MEPRYLLDKSVIRKALNGLVKIQRGIRIAAMESEALAFIYWAQQVGAELFMTPESFHVLQRFHTRPEIELFLERIQVLSRSRYYKRWAHRLREYGFTREDAKVLSFGTFSTDEVGSFLGVDAIVTMDQALINHYYGQFDSLQNRLASMTAQLPEPYCYAQLPEVVHPSQVFQPGSRGQSL